jgi:hypothetical protein
VPQRIVDGASAPAADVTYALAPQFEPFGALNQRLPPWIRFSGLDRVRYEGYRGLGYKPGAEDFYLLNRFRIGMLLRPAGWFRVYSEVQDARVAWKNPPVGPPHQDTWDLRQAYVEMGTDENGPFDLRVGRQEVNFGAGRIIGRSDWRNAGRTYDAALASMHVRKLRLTAFSLSVVVPQSQGLSHHQSGNAIHGLYGGIDDLIPHSVIEPYLFWRVSPGYRTDAGAPAKLDEKTFGLRVAGVVTPRFDYAVETVGQTGHTGTDSIGASLASVVGGYTLPSVRGRPRIFGEYFFASGDGTPGDGRHSTFHQLHPTHHDRNGLADQVGWQNLRELRTGAQFNIARNFVIAGEYNDWYLANARDSLYDTSGVVIARDVTGRSGTHIGREFDVQSSYRISRDLEIVAGIGHVVPGEFLKKTTPGAPCTYPYVGFTYFF